MKHVQSRFRLGSILAGAAAALFIAGAAAAATREVCPSGCAYDTIQGAIDAAADGDRVLVHDGTYYEKILCSKNITLLSANGPASTVIDGLNVGGTGAVVTIAPSGPYGLPFYGAMDGFTIQNGDNRGLLVAAARAKISNCIIRNNSTSGYGGGISADSGKVVELANCTIENNTATLGGGGIYANLDHTWGTSGDFLSITNCRISGNSAGGSGGGLFLMAAWDPVVPYSFSIVNSTIVGNQGASAGGIYFNSRTSSLVNDIVWGNTPDQISYLIYSPTVSYSDVQGGWTGTGNIDADPLFVAGGLRPAMGSPCINAGTGSNVTYDLDGIVRPQESGYDMGAYEFVGTCGSDNDADQYPVCLGDCNNFNEFINPGVVTDVCDGTDNNCDGIVDDGDYDGDGYAACQNDCNDSIPTTNPGAPEICDGTDNNCDGIVDDVDHDGDGYFACQNDCNDSSPTINPGAPEVCGDGIDNNCNGQFDEVCSGTIQITMAVWSKGKKTLTVEATSALEASANLSVVDFGPMTWVKRRLVWTFRASGIAANPGTVTVTGAEGSLTAQVSTVK